MKLDIAKTILIAVVILGFGLTIFFVSKSFASTCGSGYEFDKIYNKCIPKCNTETTGKIYNDNVGKCICPTGTKLVDGNCTTDCKAVGREPCGKICYDKSYQKCVDNSVCDLIRYNHNTKKCCKPTEIYNEKTGKCENCPKGRVISNGQCCDIGEVSTSDGCCKKENDHGGKCCSVWSSIDGCCNYNETLSKEGKCQITCGTEKCDARTHYCDNDIRKYDKKGNPVSTSVCVSNKICKFTEQDQIPPSITGVGDKPLHVCKKIGSSDTSEPLAACRIPDITKYTKTIKSKHDIKGQDKVCTVGDCTKFMSVYGLLDATYDEKTGECFAEISCQNAEGTKEDCDPDTCLAKDPGQCCINPNDNNKYNGLVCNDGMVCINGNECIIKNCDNCKNALNAGYGWCVRANGEQFCTNDSSKDNCSISNGDIYIKGTDLNTIFKCPQEDGGIPLSYAMGSETKNGKKVKGISCDYSHCKLGLEWQYYFYVENRTPFTFEKSGSSSDGTNQQDCGTVSTINPWDGDTVMRWGMEGGTFSKGSSWYTFTCKELPDEQIKILLDDKDASYRAFFTKKGGILDTYYKISFSRFKYDPGFFDNEELWRIVIYKKGYYDETDIQPSCN